MLHGIFSAALPASLVSLVLFARPSLATVSDYAQCLYDNSADLSTASACGHAGSLNYCFSVAPEAVDIDFLRLCYYHAGCEWTEAIVEADWTIRVCNDRSAVDLRRRLIREEAGLEDAIALVPRATSSSTDAATTTSDSSATTSDSSSTTASSSDTTTASDSTTTAASSTSASSTTTSLVCSTTKYISTSYCPTQSTGTASGSTLSCYATTTPTETCAAGLLCLTDDDTGTSGCMVPEGMGTWGWIVAVYFMIVVSVALLAVCTASYRAKSRDKKLQAEWEAAAAAKAAADESKMKRRRSQMTMASRRDSSVGLMAATTAQ